MRSIRVALFAPGNKERVMTKALESGADAVIFDLEDSVPIAAKAEARALVARAVAGAAAAVAGARPPGLWVRVNGSSTGLLTDDLTAIVRPGLDVVLLPKVETVAEVESVATALDRAEGDHGIPSGAVEIVLQIESALGVYRCFELVKASSRVASVTIGSARDGDLQTDLGCAWSIEGIELLYARSKVLLDARAAGIVNPLDGVFSDLVDEDALLKDSRLSARLGYAGRTVIHPRQIAPVRQAYAVSKEDAAYYRQVIAEFEAGEKAGTAAVTVNGKMVDYAMYQRARRVLALAELDG
jgi:citrate lyase subunit beta / citryl-CoA lyase